MAIAFFFAVGTAVGGIVAPWLFGTLIGTGLRYNLFDGHLASAALMLAAAAVEAVYGVKAEQQGLEKLAPPLSAAEPGTPEPVSRHLANAVRGAPVEIWTELGEITKEDAPGSSRANLGRSQITGGAGLTICEVTST